MAAKKSTTHRTRQGRVKLALQAIRDARSIATDLHLNTLPSDTKLGAYEDIVKALCGASEKLLLTAELLLSCEGYGVGQARQDLR